MAKKPKTDAERPNVSAGASGEVVALNVRLPKDLHRALRKIAFDEETSINALLIEAAEFVVANRKR